MEIFWFIIIAIVLAVFFILDGYDFGVGIIHMFSAKKEEDKVVIAKSAGLFWDSNEVWLVAAGGMLFMAFPVFYASVFSGLYLPLIFVLWFIIFRAISLEFRGHFNHQMWKDFWDKAFGLSSLLLALFFGVALGNIIRGVNLGGVENGISLYEKHYFFLPLWDSSFSPFSETPGVIDWFTILIGLLVVITLAIHGANWIVLKTNSSINERLKKINFYLSIILIVLTIITFIAWLKINPNSLENFIEKPYFLIFPLIYLTGIIGTLFINKVKKNITSFIFSSLIIVGGITASIASMFPVILPSTNNINESLTIFNTNASEHSLSVAVNWAILGFILLFLYLIIQKRILGGKIDDIDYGH
jgi:cytochrome d ubiquinol oxidase subunit II